MGSFGDIEVTVWVGIVSDLVNDFMSGIMPHIYIFILMPHYFGALLLSTNIHLMGYSGRNVSCQLFILG